MKSKFEQYLANFRENYKFSKNKKNDSLFKLVEEYEQNKNNINELNEYILNLNYDIKILSKRKSQLSKCLSLLENTIFGNINQTNLNLLLKSHRFMPFPKNIFNILENLQDDYDNYDNYDDC